MSVLLQATQVSEIHLIAPHNAELGNRLHVCYGAIFPDSLSPVRSPSDLSHKSALLIYIHVLDWLPLFREVPPVPRWALFSPSVSVYRRADLGAWQKVETVHSRLNIHRGRSLILHVHMTALPAKKAVNDLRDKLRQLQIDVDRMSSQARD